jgi:hypothetical protein
VILSDHEMVSRRLGDSTALDGKVLNIRVQTQNVNTECRPCP